MAFNAARYTLFSVLAVNTVCFLQYARLLALKPAALEIQRANIETTVKIPAGRVNISDRFGNIIAKSRPALELFYDPVIVRAHYSAGEAYSILTDEFKVSAREAGSALKNYNSNKRYVNVTRDLGTSNAKLPFRGFHVQTHYVREYAGYESNRSWLGFSDPYLVGHEGIELYYQRLLEAGIGELRAVVDGRRRLISARGNAADPIMLETTVDLMIQKITEEVVAVHLEKLKSDSISVLAMDPNNGEILCYLTASENGKKRNPLAVDSYEPGSIMKTFLIAAMIEGGKFDGGRIIRCDGERRFRKRKIKCHHPHGAITAADVLRLSCNIGAIELAHDIGQKEFREFLVTNTAFARKTGIDLPFESDGFLPRPDKWNYYTHTSVPFGYEIRTTALQMAASYAVFCNGGRLVRPHFLKGVVYLTGGDIYERKPETKQTRISPDTLSKVKEMLHTVVVDGTAKQFRYKGIDYAGKTGTAHIYDRKTKRYSNAYNSSFVAFAPYDEPSILIYVTVNKPRTSYFASTTAAPVAAEILKRLDVELNYFRRGSYENCFKVNRQ